MTTSIEKLRDVFSLKNVKARYAKIGHVPARYTYGGNCREDMASCLLGSFEHAMFGATNCGDDVPKATHIATNLLRAMEAGWEGWQRAKASGSRRPHYDHQDAIRVNGHKQVPLPPRGSDERKAYDHGKRLAKLLLAPEAAGDE